MLGVSPGTNIRGLESRLELIAISRGCLPRLDLVILLKHLSCHYASCQSLIIVYSETCLEWTPLERPRCLERSFFNFRKFQYSWFYPGTSGILSKYDIFKCFFPVLLPFLQFFNILYGLSLQYASVYPHKLYIFGIWRICIFTWAYSIIHGINVQKVTLGQKHQYFCAFIPNH